MIRHLLAAALAIGVIHGYCGDAFSQNAGPMSAITWQRLYAKQADSKVTTYYYSACKKIRRDLELPDDAIVEHNDFYMIPLSDKNRATETIVVCSYIVVKDAGRLYRVDWEMWCAVSGVATHREGRWQYEFNNTLLMNDCDIAKCAKDRNVKKPTLAQLKEWADVKRIELPVNPPAPR